MRSTAANLIVFLGTIILVKFVISSIAVAGPFEDGNNAFRRGDYSKALSLIRPLADKGNIKAQLLLHEIYGKGRGVAPEPLTALKYLTLAAEQGHLLSQVEMLTIYADTSNDSNLIQLYKWMSIVTSRMDIPTQARSILAQSRSMLDELKQLMSPEQLAEARRLINQSAEKAAEAKSMALDNIGIKNWNWRKEAYGSVMLATFTFQNKNDFDVKDIEVTCEHSARSGTKIDKNTKKIYEIIKAASSKTVRDFNMGFVHSQAASSSCRVSDFVQKAD